jgi:hypothetical protein
VVPGPQAQAPAPQIIPPVHLIPQPPQLLLSVCRFTHALAQSCRPGPQPGAHVPLEHASVPHTTLHVPQLFGSKLVFVHAPLQSVPPFGHEQALFAHVSPPVHLTPQAPQLFASPVVSTHAPPQSVSMFGQTAIWHTPSTQASPTAHVTLHAPQSLKVAWVSTQAPLQNVRPAGQVQ